MRLRVLSAGANTSEVGVSSRIYVAVATPFPTGPVAVPYLVRMAWQVRVTGFRTRLISAAGTPSRRRRGG